MLDYYLFPLFAPVAPLIATAVILIVVTTKLRYEMMRDLREQDVAVRERLFQMEQKLMDVERAQASRFRQMTRMNRVAMKAIQICQWWPPHLPKDTPFSVVADWYEEQGDRERVRLFRGREVGSDGNGREHSDSEVG